MVRSMFFCINIVQADAFGVPFWCYAKNSCLFYPAGVIFDEAVTHCRDVGLAIYSAIIYFVAAQYIACQIIIGFPDNRPRRRLQSPCHRAPSVARAASPAVSVRKIRGPIARPMAPAAMAAFSSSSVDPPTGAAILACRILRQAVPLGLVSCACHIVTALPQLHGAPAARHGAFIVLLMCMETGSRYFLLATFQRHGQLECLF